MSNIIEEELLKLKTNLQKALDDNDEVLCYDILNVLCKTTVTLGIINKNLIIIILIIILLLDSLIKTKVGHIVKDVKNKYNGNKTSTLAKDLMANWKKTAEIQGYISITNIY